MKRILQNILHKLNIERISVFDALLSIIWRLYVLHSFSTMVKKLTYIASFYVLGRDLKKEHLIFLSAMRNIDFLTWPRDLIFFTVRNIDFLTQAWFVMSESLRQQIRRCQDFPWAIARDRYMYTLYSILVHSGPKIFF